MTIWTDAHLPAGLAPWLSEAFPDVEAFSVQYLGLRDAEDEVIFRHARQVEAVVMTKDRDFVRSILTVVIPTALTLLESNPLVEIGG